MNLQKIALASSAIAVALSAAVGAGLPSSPALSLGWYGGACDDALAQNPGDPAGCRYEARESNCGDDIDNDSDEAADCADSDCAGFERCGSCISSGAESCHNGGDDDCDGQIDLADQDCCAGDWLSAWTSGLPLCGGGCGRTETDVDGDCERDDRTWLGADSCADGADGEGDGLVDCADPDCVDDLFCVQEICANGSDDNGNGFVDCQDISCWNTAECASCVAVTESCGNEADDDCDGSVDCQDSDCAGEAICGGATVAVAEALGTGDAANEAGRNTPGAGDSDEGGGDSGTCCVCFYGQTGVEGLDESCYLEKTCDKMLSGGKKNGICDTTSSMADPGDSVSRAEQAKDACDGTAVSRLFGGGDPSSVVVMVDGHNDPSAYSCCADTASALISEYVIDGDPIPQSIDVTHFGCQTFDNESGAREAARALQQQMDSLGHGGTVTVSGNQGYSNLANPGDPCGKMMAFTVCADGVETNLPSCGGGCLYTGSAQSAACKDDEGRRREQRCELKAGCQTAPVDNSSDPNGCLGEDPNSSCCPNNGSWR